MASPWGNKKSGGKSGGQKGGRKGDVTSTPKVELPKDKGCAFATKLRGHMVDVGYADWYPNLSKFGISPCKPNKACNNDCTVYIELKNQVRRLKNGRP